VLNDVTDCIDESCGVGQEGSVWVMCCEAHFVGTGFIGQTTNGMKNANRNFSL